MVLDAGEFIDATDEKVREEDEQPPCHLRDVVRFRGDAVVHQVRPYGVAATEVRRARPSLIGARPMVTSESAMGSPSVGAAAAMASLPRWASKTASFA